MESDIQKIYALERALLAADVEEAVLKEAVAKGEYNLRNAKFAVTEYEGSFRSFLDKLRGIRENRIEQLQQSLCHAQQTLLQNQNGLEKVLQSRKEALAARSEFPALVDIPECREKARQEAFLCIYVLQSMLKELEEAMKACRDLEQGRRVGELISIQERQEILSKPSTLGIACGSWINRLEKALSELSIACSVPEFFRNPALYLAATQYTHRDRLNSAMDQTLHLLKWLDQLNNMI